MLEEFVGHPIPVTWKDWRPGDQRVNMNDTGKALQELGWQPKISVKEGIQMLYEWVVEHRELFA
jgi:nucleoside-diphosphate-sugar epimerase